MFKKAFTLLEIIFVVTIIAIIITVAIPKLDESLNKTNIIKIKNDITMIRDGITKYKNKMILQNNHTTLEKLDEDSDKLFSKILIYPIISSILQKANSWSKISDTTYKIYLNSQDNLLFIYDKHNYTFDCDNENDLCKKLSQ
jgi:prepilin-type N-terminal cleavage/methylation domain-containing protein